MPATSVQAQGRTAAGFQKASQIPIPASARPPSSPDQARAAASTSSGLAEVAEESRDQPVLNFDFVSLCSGSFFATRLQNRLKSDPECFQRDDETLFYEALRRVEEKVGREGERERGSASALEEATANLRMALLKACEKAAFASRPPARRPARRSEESEERRERSGDCCRRRAPVERWGPRAWSWANENPPPSALSLHVSDRKFEVTLFGVASLSFQFAAPCCGPRLQTLSGFRKRAYIYIYGPKYQNAVSCNADTHKGLSLMRWEWDPSFRDFRPRARLFP